MVFYRLSKKNCEMNICEKECLNEISESSSVTGSILDNFNNCGCKKKKEKKTIFYEKNDVLPSNYLDQTIFRLLIPALEETLIEASKQNVLRVIVIF